MATRFTFTDQYDEEPGSKKESGSLSRRNREGLDDPRLRASETPVATLLDFNKKDLNKVATDLGIKGASRTKRSELFSQIVNHPGFSSAMAARQENRKEKPSSFQKSDAPSEPEDTGFDTDELESTKVPETEVAMSREDIERRARELFIEDVDERDDEDLLQEIQKVEAGDFGDEPPDDPPRTGFGDPFEDDDEGDDDPSFDPSSFQGATELPEDADISPQTPPSEAARIEREIVQRRKREQRLQILQQQRRQQLQMRMEKRQRSLENKLRRKQIQTEAQQASQIETGSSTSDRIIRRLSAFSIGRSMGSSGQLFAALSEMMVFQPEEQAADQAQEQAKEDAQRQKEEQLRKLEEEILQQSVADMQQAAELQDIVDKARAQLADPSVDVSSEALGTFEQSLQDFIVKYESGVTDPQPASAQAPRTPDTTQAPEAPTPETESSSLPETPETPETPEPQTETGGTGGTIPPVTPPPPPPEQSSGGGAFGWLNDQIGELGKGLNSTTKIFIATAATVEALNLASKAATSTIKTIGDILQDPTNPRPAVNAAGSALVTGTSTIGAGAGAAVGTAIMPVVGTLVGAAIGGTIGRTVTEPVVEAVNQVYGAIDSLARQSLGIETIQASVLGDVRLFLEKMERSQRLDPITADFVEARTDLSSALGDLQGLVIEFFGPKVTEMVELLADAITIATSTMEIFTAIREMIPEPISMPDLRGDAEGLRNWMGQMADLVETISDYLRDDGSGDINAQQALQQFFQGQGQFRNQVPQFNFGP